MAATLAPPQQFKQPSRKGKRAWRKNVDVTEVEQGLEAVRDEVIQGGIIAEKASTELFTFDLAGNESIQRAYHKIHRPLKADEILAQRSAVPALDTHKRSSSKVTDGVLEPTSKRLRAGGISHRELERLKRIAYGGGDTAHVGTMQGDGGISEDLWAQKEEAMGRKYSFLEPPKPIKEPKTLKRAPVSLSANSKDIPAVPKPKAETSYNPQSTAYFEALEREGEKEVQAELKRRQELEKEAEKSRRAEKARQAAEAHEQRMKDDDNAGYDDDSVWEGIVSEPETEAQKRQVTRKKTRAERNKIARRKEVERRAALEAKVKRRAQQLAQLKQIMSSIDARERGSRSMLMTNKADAGDDGNANDHALSSSEDDEVILRKKPLGKAPILKETLDLILPDDLRDSLRLLKPEGNLLRERFRNMLLRGKLESRAPVLHQKKRKVKVTEKWSYKDWKLT